MGLFKSASSAGRGRAEQSPPSKIRGKISGPIPIPDDEFPIRAFASGIAEEEIPSQPTLASQRGSTATSANAAFTHDATLESKTNSLAHSGPSQDSTVLTPVTRRRTNRSSALRYSTLSEATDSASPSRKKSSLREAIGKLFGRRNKKQGSRSTSESDGQRLPRDHHYSDSGVAKQGPIDSDTSPKRSASLPITEFNKALRSHSIGPDDFLAIHSARNSLQSDTAFLRRRAATASEGVPSFGLRDENLDITGLSPRPVSAHGRDVVDEHDPEAIGRAVSIDILASHRRSRSLSQLPDIADGPGLARKRSEEIRYWRESHNPGPLSPGLSSPDREGPETAELVTEVCGEDQPSVAPPQPPQAPEPFNFGTLNLMKITDAATLEDRVASLESQNERLERLVTKLYELVPGISPYLGSLEHTAPEVHASPSVICRGTSPRPAAISTQEKEMLDVDPPSTSYSTSQRSNQSFEDDGQTFIGSIHQSTKEAPRPMSNVTIRGVTSLPSLPKDIPGDFTSDKYNSIKMMLDAERAARQTLEDRVARLTQMVKLMSRTTHKLQTDPLGEVYLNVSTLGHGNSDFDDLEPVSASIDDASEVFRTPADEYPVPEYSAYDDESHDDEVENASRKRAARTMSLGQLTHGKPKHSQQPGAGVDL